MAFGPQVVRLDVGVGSTSRRYQFYQHYHCMRKGCDLVHCPRPVGFNAAAEDLSQCHQPLDKRTDVARLLLDKPWVW